jgi:hypothetical protein
MDLFINGDEDAEPIRCGIPRAERRARRQGFGRVTTHLEDAGAVVAVVGFNPYPDLEGTEYVFQ